MIITPEKMPNFTPYPTMPVYENVPTTTEISSQPPQTTISSITQPSSTISNEYTNLKIENESNLYKKLRESVLKHEEKQSVIENIDSTNRFIYHHLGSDEQISSSTTPSPSTTSISPPSSPEISLNRIRFPVSSSNILDGVTSSDLNNNHHQKRNNQDLVRFPGPITNHHRVNIDENKNEEIHRPYSWLPPGWKIDTNPNGNFILKFRARQQQHEPSRTNHQTSSFISPPAHHWRASAIQSRENSKLPTEDLYRQITSQDIYRVLESRSNHRNR